MFASQIEKGFAALLLWLPPPMPVELKAEYIQATPAEQADGRRQYLWQVFRWASVISVVVFAMVVKWLWECGALIWLGLGSGFAHAADIQTVQSKLVVIEQQQTQFQRLYEIDQLEKQLRDIDKEIFDIDSALRAAERAHKPLDPLHVDRKQKLESDRKEVERKLSAKRET